jgi:hypothetical protein
MKRSSEVVPIIVLRLIAKDVIQIIISKGTDNNAENSTLRLHKGYSLTETKTKVCSLKQIMYLRGHFRLTSGEIRVCCSNSKP